MSLVVFQIPSAIIFLAVLLLIILVALRHFDINDQPKEEE